MASNIPLSQILQEHPLERPLNYAGSTVWLRVPDAYSLSMAEGTIRSFLEPLHRNETKPRQHWKIQKNIEPITLKIFLEYDHKVVTVKDYDFDIEAIETFISVFGENNVKVRCRSIDARKKGR